MELDKNLVSEFAKITNDEKRKQQPVNFLGTVVEYEGTKYVKLDGSDILTPIQDDKQISSTVEIQDSDRVTVQIQNHTATVTGNISSPSTTGNSVEQRLQIVFDVVDDQIVAKVQASEAKLSRLIVTEDAIKTLVSTAILNSETGTNERISSEIKQFADSITISVNNSGTASSMTIKGDGFEITSPNISFSGLVTYTNLNSRGYTTLDLIDVRNDLSDIRTTTTINGARIETGEIDASAVSFEKSIYDSSDGLYKGGGVQTATGSDGKKTTYGAKLYGYGDKYRCLASNAGVSLVGPNCYLYLAGNGIHSSVAIKNDSDRNKKNTISEDLSQYETFFYKLRPVSFKYNNGTSNRHHTGFVAQDVEDALRSSGLSSQDFAALVIERYKNDDGDECEDYGLRYTEFVSLNTYMIQKLSSRVDALEKEIAELKTMVKGAST